LGDVVESLDRLFDAAGQSLIGVFPVSMLDFSIDLPFQLVCQC
jgi:hypothetical protein